MTFQSIVSLLVFLQGFCENSNITGHYQLKVIIATEACFQANGSDGIVPEPAFDANFWQRYLAVFEQIIVLARVTGKTTPEASKLQCLYPPHVYVAALPAYHGLLDLSRNWFRVQDIIRRLPLQGSCIIGRVPGLTSDLLVRQLQHGYPYGLEVVGDPAEVFRRGIVRHPLRPILRVFFCYSLRKQCRNAAAISYVNETILPIRYPPSRFALCSYYSSINLNKALITPPRSKFPQNSEWLLLFVGSLNQLYKGLDILLCALAKCMHEGLKFRLIVVGDGKYRVHLENLSVELGLGDRVYFKGQLPSGQPVFSEMDNADILIHPARTEGKPRVIIEAMARGLPCVGTKVGGIPELLSKNWLVPPGDINRLADKLRWAMSHPDELGRVSLENHATASQYTSDVLDARRHTFYQYLCNVTEKHLTCHHEGILHVK